MVLIGHVEVESYKKRCRERRMPPISWRTERDIFVLLKCKETRVGRK
jgi:hypothetical protein